MFWESASFQFSVALIYGLAFFFLAGVVFFYTQQGARCDLVGSFRLLGWFALLHGVTDTAAIFNVEPLSSWAVATPVRFMRLILSFCASVILAEFGVKMLIRDDDIRIQIRKYLYLVLGIAIVFLAVLLITTEPRQAIIFTAVFFGFPVSMATGGAFFMLARESKTVQIKRLQLAFNAIAFWFAVYALLKAVRLFVDSEAAIALIKLMRIVTALSLAGFTGVALSRLRPASKPYAELTVVETPAARKIRG
jgi:hypothetical protein